MRFTPAAVWPGDAVSSIQSAFSEGLRHDRRVEDDMAKGTIKIDVERCKACGFCVEFCPTHVLALSSAFNSKGYHPPHAVDPEKCSGCDLCGMYCPDFAIHGYRVPQPGKNGDTANES
jgi:2-oxoglutarate ferredoxin oxidoreductase subunit delta